MAFTIPSAFRHASHCMACCQDHHNARLGTQRARLRPEITPANISAAADILISLHYWIVVCLNAGVEHEGVAVAAAAVMGSVAAVLLIWRREHLIARSTMRGPLSAGLAARGSNSVPSGSLNLTLELDGKGEPLLLGQGSSAKVSLFCSESVLMHGYSITASADAASPAWTGCEASQVLHAVVGLRAHASL